MDFRTASNWVVLFLALGTTLVLGRRPRVNPFWILLLLTGVLLSFRSGRDVWLLVIICVALISSSRLLIAANEEYVLSKVQILVIIAAVGILLLLAARIGHVSEGNLRIA